jgi:hypothetical protein
VYYQHYYYSLRLRFRLVNTIKDFWILPTALTLQLYKPEAQAKVFVYYQHYYHSLRLRFKLVNYLFVTVVLVRLVLPGHT